MTHEEDVLGLRKRLERVKADRFNIDKHFRLRASDLLDGGTHLPGWSAKAERLLDDVNADRRAISNRRMASERAAEDHAARVRAENRRKLDAALRDLPDPM